MKPGVEKPAPPKLDEIEQEPLLERGEAVGEGKVEMLVTVPGSMGRCGVEPEGGPYVRPHRDIQPVDVGGDVMRAEVIVVGGPGAHAHQVIGVAEQRVPSG